MSTRQVHGCCALCISRCGCIATLEEGVQPRIEADPAHPTGGAFCAKGRAAPELATVLQPGVTLNFAEVADPAACDPVSGSDALKRVPCGVCFLPL